MPITSWILWGITLTTTLVTFGHLFVKDGYKGSYFVPALWLIPPLLIVPFAYSDGNERAISLSVLEVVLLYYPRALLIYCGGAIFCVAGIMLGRRNKHEVGFRLLDRAAGALSRFSNSGGRLLALFALQILIFIYLIMNGMIFGTGQTLGFEDTTIRPILNTWIVINTFLIIVVGIRIINGPDVLSVIYFIVLFTLSLATGQRGLSVLVLLPLFLIYASARKTRNILLPATLLALLIPAAAGISFLRAQSDASSDGNTGFTITEEFLYGNQFSDVRDLAWILSGFDGEHLGGKTYIAGYTPFVPSFISTFRQEWGWGRWSAETAGLDPAYHGGLRGGLFAELYFNFGPYLMLLGALFIGFVFGQIVSWEVSRGKSGFAAALVSGGTAYFMGSIVASLVFTPGFFVGLIIGAFILLG